MARYLDLAVHVLLGQIPMGGRVVHYSYSGVGSMLGQRRGPWPTIAPTIHLPASTLDC